MAVVVNPTRHHRAPRPPWMRCEPPHHDSLLAAFIVALLMVSAITFVVLAPEEQDAIARTLVTALRRREPARPLDGAVSPLSGVGDGEEHAPARRSPAPGADEIQQDDGSSLPRLTVGGRARVVNTDGVGVVLRTAPRDGARRPAGLLEGMNVSVLDLVGGEWAYVQSGTGQPGWVPARFLAPSD